MLGGPLLACALLLASEVAAWPGVVRALDLLPSLLFALTAIVCASLGRSHAVVASISLLILHWQLRLLVDLRGALGEDLAPQVLTALAALVPINLTYLGLAREHGLRSSETLNRLAFQVAQPLLIGWLVLPLPHDWLKLLGDGWLGAEGQLPLGPLGQPILGAFFGAAVSLAAMATHGRSEQAAGLFWALLCTLCALLTGPPGPAADLLLCAAGAAVLIGARAHHIRRLDWHELTELGTRRALHRAMRGTRDLHCVAIVDLDHCKPLIDRWGAAVGEQILRSVAFKLRRVRGGACAYYMHADRFALHFPRGTHEEVGPYVEELRLVVCETPFYIRRMNRRSESLSVSVGLAESNDRWSSPEEMIEAAEGAVLDAKAMGRNRVRVAGEPVGRAVPGDGDPSI